MPISVIVSNLNGERFLPRLLETLRAQKDVDLEIIIVDRESKDGSRDYLRGREDVIMLTEPAASGLVSGYAAGAKVARFEHLFFCNEDMWFDPNCLSLLSQCISLERRIGAADPWQWTYDGQKLIHGGTRLVSAVWNRWSVYPRRGYNYLAPLKNGDVVPFGCAGAILIHRQMYEEIGGWDTTFFLDCEDVDIFLRAWQRNWRCVVVPEAKVYHAVGMSNNQVQASGQKIVNRRYVEGRSNMAVVGFKYFTGFSLFWPLAVQILPLFSNIVKLRWKTVLAEIRSAALTFRRWPEIRSFRRANAKYAQSKPGQLFFLQPEHQVRETN